MEQPKMKMGEHFIFAPKQKVRPCHPVLLSNIFHQKKNCCCCSNADCFYCRCRGACLSPGPKEPSIVLLSTTTAQDVRRGDGTGPTAVVRRYDLFSTPCMCKKQASHRTHTKRVVYGSFVRTYVRTAVVHNIQHTACTWVPVFGLSQQ